MKKAFTLAETLIALVVIGVIAAMVVPVIQQNIQKQGYVAGLKKFYATADQALNKLASDYGCTGDLSCTGLPGSDGDGNGSRPFGNAIIKYFNVAKNCGNYNTLATGCFADFAPNFDGSGTPSNTNDSYNFLTEDGMSIAMLSIANWSNKNCALNQSITGDGPLSKICGRVTVDVNGLKAPNILGRDVFIFFITNQKGKGPSIYQRGGLDYGHTPDHWKDSSGNIRLCKQNVANSWGGVCTARVIEEGWQMNY